MLKTGSEHILTSAQLICNTKQNYFFLHKTGSATTSSFASAIKDKKKKGNAVAIFPLILFPIL